MGSTGAWDDGQQTLVLDLSISGFVEGSAVTIHFQLKNQGTTKESADLTVIASPLIASTSLAKNSAVPDGSSGIHVPQSGDFEPFSIRGVEWEVKDIGQTSPYPCAPNTITATLQPSVPIYQSCLSEFTITGLTGSKTPDNTAIVVTNVSPNNDNVISPSGGWTQGTGSLEISLQQGDSHPMLAGQAYVFSVQLTNDFSDQPSAAEIVTTSTSNYLVSQATQFMSNDDRDPDDLSGYNIYQAQPGDLNPMYIRDVSWEVKDIGQSSPYPCASNTITTTLQPSVPIYQSCLSNFTLTGLQGTSTPDGALLLTHNPANSVLQTTASWKQVTGSLVVTLISDSNPMEAGASYEFSFDVVNDVAHQASPVSIVVSETILTGIQTLSPDMSVPHASYDLYEPVAGDLAPLYIRTVEWTVRNIGQTSPYPCAQNTIKTTLQPSVPIYQSCLSAFTLSGLTGSSTASGSLPLSNFDATVLDSTASWNNNIGQLVVQLLAGDDHPMLPGVSYTFDFEVTNSFAAQHSPVEVLVAPYQIIRETVT